MKTILVDCDDVLLDWISGFSNFCKLKGLKPKGHKPSDWDMSGWLQVEPSDVKRLIHEFNEESDMFAEIPALSDAHKIVPHLYEEGYRFVVITACSDKSHVINRRKDNLHTLFGDVFDEIHCIPTGHSKVELLQKYQSTLWVEDNYHNALAGIDTGHKSVVIRRPHNQKFEQSDNSGAVWLDDWHEIYGNLHSLMNHADMRFA